uniref:ATP synthase subunit a n=1 Tax=Vertigo pusilla TaxID=1282417 RepID=A0A0A6ZAF6_9EUPU|nr:ATP synthase F0 subunit 6 [Vertigo pusilla]AGC52884.1 ATP synthase F0 subunit 6 [Vertigo pusilla]
MMTDLFSSMDGNHSIVIWAMPLVMTVIFISNSIFLTTSMSPITATITNLWESSDTYFTRKSLLTSLMLFIILSNFLGLVPLVFSSTTSLWVNSSLALICWGTILVSGWVFSPQKSAAHLAPSGAPGMLMPFLILIETISILIRPITLTVRLVANISAGHIILALLANVLSSSLSIFSWSTCVSIMIFYYLFEMFVSFIQAYIFTLLISLYMAEHP